MSVTRAAPVIEATVIIPVKNPGPDFLLLLTSLARQDARFPWEVVVVDNGTTDGSLHCLEEFKQFFRVRLIDGSARPGGSYARNIGAQEASSKKLLFVDADDEVAPNYVARISEALDDHEMVASRVDSAALNPSPLQRALDWQWQETCIHTFFNYLPATGSYIGIRRETFWRVGGFPLEFARCLDIAFCWRAQLSGVEIVFVPETTYFYRYRKSLRALFRQYRGYGTAEPLLYKEFREAGMPGRSLPQLVRELRDQFREVIRAPSKIAFQRWLVFGLAIYVGRIQGSLRHRVVYL